MCAVKGFHCWTLWPLCLLDAAASSMRSAQERTVVWTWSLVKQTKLANSFFFLRNAQIIFFFHICPPFASVIVFQHACEGRGMSAVCFCRSRSHRCQLRREPLKVEPVPSDCLSVSNTQSVSRSRRKPHTAMMKRLPGLAAAVIKCHFILLD